ncbi:TolC family protein [Polaromonas sp. A23]|uniref:TolC family protein n=1 Tax=Polaromonas sp. A23 TaxID=1944133 RepID=UPI0009876E08|nr:TolC family protein [Polaromonas sp. A23]OOG36596.1 transporter [Polaromonas sp. A23]
MFHSPLRRSRAAAVWVAFLTLPAWATEPLTLPEAQALAVARSQLLAANSASITASREMATAAGQLPDPVLKFGIENLPINGPDRLSLSRDFMTMRRIGLSQELPRADKRQLRTERFEREAARTQAERQLNLVNIRRETAKAWLEHYYTQQMRALVLQQIEEAKLQTQTAETGFGSGRNSQADVFAARAALAMLQDRLSQLVRQEKNAALMLARWVGTAAERPVAGAPSWQQSHLDEGRLEEHFQYHPDLVMLRAQIETAQTEARLADANRKPDWSVEGSYSQRGSAYSNMVSFGISIPLQWDRANRQDRELAARLAMVDEARAKYEEMLRNHDAEVRGLLNDWRNGKERVARYRDELIPLAKQRTEAALTSYRTGKSDLASTLTARRDEVETQIQALTVEMETARAWAQVNFLIPEHSTAAKDKP